MIEKGSAREQHRGQPVWSPKSVEQREKKTSSSNDNPHTLRGADLHAPKLRNASDGVQELELEEQEKRCRGLCDEAEADDSENSPVHIGQALVSEYVFIL